MRRAVTGRTGTSILAVHTKLAHRSLLSSLGVLLTLGACVGGVSLSGCGGGSSEAPTLTGRGAYGGVYSASVNEIGNGATANPALPSGTVKLTADTTSNTLTAAFNLTDARRSAAPSRAVSTIGDLVGTYNGKGEFDLSGKMREYDSRDGSITTGQSVRIQGSLPEQGDATTVTIEVGKKTATGTLRYLSPLLAAPNPSAP